MRILQVPRRDYALAVQRNAFKNRGPLYSDKAVTMRCARPDQSTQTVRHRGGGRPRLTPPCTLSGALLFFFEKRGSVQ
jgi:hypothetical protein